MSKPDMILRSNVINLFNCKRLRYFQYKMVNITVKQARIQNGTSVELKYPVTTSTFILYHLNYLELITLFVIVRTWKENI